MFVTDPLTLCEVLDGLPHAAIERSSVGGALERQATLPVVHSPVMESGRGFSVDQILLQKALQDHLITNTSIKIEGSDFWRLAHVDSSLTCLSLSRSEDEKAVSSQELQVSWDHLTDTHSTETTALLSQPTPARLIPRHHHSFHAHYVTVTAGRDTRMWFSDKYICQR